MHDRAYLQCVKDRQGDKILQDVFGVWLILAFLSLGSCGETQFLSNDEMWWDQYFWCPDATWTVMKTLKQASMLYGPGITSYMFDFYHGLGFLSLVENGLCK